MKILRYLSVAAATAMALTLPAATANAVTNHPTKELITPRVQVTTTTGVGVHFRIDVSRGYGSTMVSVSLDNKKSGYTLAESHGWSFDTAGSVMSYTNGKGLLKSGTEFGPYGAVKIAFAKVAQHTTSCKNDANIATTVTNVKVSLKGTLNFAAKSSATHASAWGTVRKGTSTKPYHFSWLDGHYISTTNGPCRMSGGTGGGTMPCFSETDWNGPMQATMTSFQFIGGFGSSDMSAIEALRDRSLSRPAGAERFDAVVAPAPIPALDPTGGAAGDGELVVTTQANSAATGTATLDAVAPAAVQPGQSCDNNGTTATQQESDYSASFTNDTTTPLSVQSAVGGNLTTPDDPGSSPDTAAMFYVYSVA